MKILFALVLLVLISCGGNSDNLGKPDLIEENTYIVIDDGFKGADGIDFIETDSKFMFVTPWQESNIVRLCVSDKTIEFICDTVGENISPEWAIINASDLSIISFGKQIVNHSLNKVYDIDNSGTWLAGDFIDYNLSGYEEVVAGSGSGNFVIFDASGNVQFSSIHNDIIMQIEAFDMDYDGDKDIVVFDRSEIGYYEVPSMVYYSLHKDKENSFRLGEIVAPDYIVITKVNPPSIVELDNGQVNIYDVTIYGGQPKDVALADMNNNFTNDFVITSVGLGGNAKMTYYLENKTDFVSINNHGKKSDNIVVFDFDSNGYLDVMTTFEIPNSGVVLFD